MPYANTQAMQKHLEQISLSITANAHGIVVMDRAGWHKSAALNIPENLSILFLPPYSPELNPAENIWQYLRQNWLSNRVFKTWDDIVDACCQAWNRLTSETGRIRSIASRNWAVTSQ
jgi:transposase